MCLVLGPPPETDENQPHPWHRLINDPIRNGTKCITCQLCTKDGTLEETNVNKKTGDKNFFAYCKNAVYGQRFVAKLESRDKELESS